MVKLDRSNYFAWEAQMITHLRGNGLLRFIETDIDTEDVVDSQQDQLLLGWIYSTITPSVLPQGTSYSTSFKVWTALTRIFNARSKTRILHNKNKLTNFKKENRSVEDYLLGISRLAEEVCEAGVPLDDGELTLIALGGLDSSYDGFVMAHTARADDLTFAAFQGLLQAHKERNSKPASTIIPMANVVSGDLATSHVLGLAIKDRVTQPMSRGTRILAPLTMSRQILPTFSTKTLFQPPPVYK